MEGDLVELFEKRAGQNLSKARRQFGWDVVRGFRPRNLGFKLSLSNLTFMLRNHLTIALRVFRRDLSLTSINVAGLALSFAITLLILQYARFEFSYESTHPQASQIMRLTMDYLDGNTVVTQDCETYPPLGPTMKASLPEVEDFTRAYSLDRLLIKVGEETFYEDKGYAADPAFFDFFHYPLIEGSIAGAFLKPHEVILNESTARRFFGRTDIVGEVVQILHSEGELGLKVVGVMPDCPPNTHLPFNMLVSYPTMTASFGEKDENWNGNNTFTYIMLRPGTQEEAFQVQLEEFNKKLVAEEKIENERVIAQAMEDIHLYSHKTFEAEPNGDANSLFFLLLVALLVIVSAYVNYVNLATSRSVERAKEVGIRKVIGSTRSQLIGQFLFESFLVNVLAAIMAVGLIWLGREVFLELTDLGADFAILSDQVFWLMLVGFVLLGVFLSGLYPALVLSGFAPALVLKGKFSRSGKGLWLRKSLVIFQFAVTLILLTQSFIVYQQLNYMREKELGVNIDRTVVINGPALDSLQKRFVPFKQSLIQQPQIEGVAISGTVPGLPVSDMNTTTGIHLADELNPRNNNFYLTGIDSAYLSLMEIKLLAGENFQAGNLKGRNIIVNEEAIRQWGLQSPEEAIQKTVKFWGRKWQVVGVIQNYHHESGKSAHVPMIFYYFDEFSEYASIRISGGEVEESLALIEQTFESHFPFTPFSYFFLDQRYDEQFKADLQFQKLFNLLTGFAILIACLGLFALASFVIHQRTKEIGIRKIIGASTRHIMVLLTRDFIQTVMWAIVIGLPLTYWLAEFWLTRFPFRFELNAWVFVLPALAVVLLAILSLSVKTLKTALANPVDSLRAE